MAGWIGIYLEEEDSTLLRARLNQDQEIAFLMPEGPGRWRAVWESDDVLGKTMLWHVPGGPLPLLRPDGSETFIEDPFAGWRDLAPGMDSSVPYFGLGCPSTVLLELYVRGWRGLLRPNMLPLSGITWYGARPYSGPHPSTRRWWSRFRRWLRQHTTRITRSGPLQGPRGDVHAFPVALHSIQAGVERDPSPLVRLSPLAPSRRILIEP
jgi:hypothetical protein